MLEPKPKGPRKPIIFYYLISLLILLLFNYLVMPMFFSREVTVVSYSEFLNAVEENRVSIVELDSDGQRITFVAQDRQGRTNTYQTVAMPDPGLVERLRSS